MGGPTHAPLAPLAAPCRLAIPIQAVLCFAKPYIHPPIYPNYLESIHKDIWGLIPPHQQYAPTTLYTHNHQQLYYPLFIYNDRSFLLYTHYHYPHLPGQYS